MRTHNTGFTSTGKSSDTSNLLELPFRLMQWTGQVHFTRKDPRKSVGISIQYIARINRGLFLTSLLVDVYIPGHPSART